MNKIILTGTIDRNIEIKKSKKGNSYLTNTIAVVRDSNPKMIDYIDFMCIGEQAKMLENSYKGAMIEISGELQKSTFKNKEGKSVTTYSVFVQTLQLLDSPMGEEVELEEPVIPEDIQDDLPF